MGWSYLAQFLIYTLAMVGLIFFAVFVYKKTGCANLGMRKNSNFAVDDVLSLNPRKTLYIIKVGAERFLIAADVDRTTLLSKLEDSEYESELIA